MLHPALSSAQAYSIKGRVINGRDSATRGSLVITDARTKSLVRIAEYENGRFELNDISASETDILISADGGTDTTVHVKNSTNDPIVDLGVILLKSVKQLDEVAVAARTPLFQRTADGSRINVANTMLATSTGTSELLSKIPGISVAGNKVNVFGKGEAMICINGKQVAYERFLSLPVHDIKSIEVITNPSAKYDARGRAVINILLKQKDSEGLSGNLTQNATWARHFLNGTVLGLNYRKNKLSLSGDYGINLGKDWNENVYTTSFAQPAGEYRTKGYYRENTKLANVANYRLGMSYDINNKTDVSVQYDGLYALYNLAVENDGDSYTPAGALTSIAMYNNGKTVNRNHAGNINVNRKLDTNGSSFFAGVQYNNFRNILYDQIRERITYPSGNYTSGQRVNDGNNGIDLYIAQFDINKNFKDGGKLEMGGKYSYVANKGSVKFRVRPDGDVDWTEYAQFANGFIYQEYVPAVYALYSGKYGKWDYAAGSRAEQSIVTGFSRKLNTRVIDTGYFNLFPNAKLGYGFNDKWSTMVNYSYRINRPLYQDIDPFVWYIDSLTSIQGNSRLIPEFAHSLEWSVACKSFTIKVGYANTNNAIRSIVRPGTTGINSVVFTKENIEHLHQYTVSADIPIERKHFSSYSTIAWNLNKFVDSRPFFLMKPVSPQLYLYTYNQMDVYKGYKADVRAEYTGSSADGINTREAVYYASAGLSKSYLKNTLSCQLSFNDVFRTAKWNGTKNVGVITSAYNARYNVHYFRVTLNYKIGTLKKINYKNRAVNETEYNRIKK